MVEDDASSNIEWEQKKIGTKMRQSRKIDLQKVLVAEKKDRKNFDGKAGSPKDLPKGLKKLRTKIREVSDDDEDEEENDVVFFFSVEDENSSLLNALKDEEKSKLQFNKTLENQKMQQTAGKMEAILMADRMSKQLGLQGLKKKVVNQNVQDVALSSETFDKAIKQNVAAKTKIRTEGLSTAETSNMVKGLKKMKQAVSVSEQMQVNMLESMKAEELVRIGKSNDDRKTAEMILEKSGRKEAKNSSKSAKEKNNQKVKNAIKHVKDRN